MSAGRPNRLAKEKSPYLLEHSLNPVDWYSWGEEALSKAKNDNKPIFLSIGYSTCHWCHQMAKESFEDEKTAALINRNFIPIKVDREERPEVDAYYMGAVQAMTGGGGWPLSVFLTPDLKAFYGGTYFPPEPRYGMPSFRQVLEFVASLWRDKRDEVKENSARVLRSISPEAQAPGTDLNRTMLDEGYSSLAASFDPEHGGFGRAPKFPLPGLLSFLLRYYYRNGKELALKTVLKTLDEMSAGGIRDHVGGGFHRYSTDRVWLVPHFEKMLYDNALLAKVYGEAYQITGKQAYAEVVKETLGWILEELKDDGGGFYSAVDADTDEGEGVYYTWTPEEVLEAAGPEAGSAFNRIYGITQTGNFEGRTIPHLKPGEGTGNVAQGMIPKARLALNQARSKRPKPAKDTKILTSWNGLAISALAFSAAVFDEPSYSRAASTSAKFVLEKLSKDGRLLRRYAGGEADLEGTLEDYAFYIQGLIDLFETTSKASWLEEAVRLTKIMMEEYDDKADGGFYLTKGDVPAKLKETYDGPMPSGNSVAALDLIRLAELTGNEDLRRTSERTLKAFGKELDRQPSAHTTALSALDMLLHGAKEIVISAPTKKEAEEMKGEVFRHFIPAKVVLAVTMETFDNLSGMSTLLNGRRPTSRARVYVCENFACKVPADSVTALRAQLEPTKG